MTFIKDHSLKKETQTPYRKEGPRKTIDQTTLPRMIRSNRPGLRTDKDIGNEMQRLNTNASDAFIKEQQYRPPEQPRAVYSKKKK